MRLRENGGFWANISELIVKAVYFPNIALHILPQFILFLRVLFY